MNSEQTIETLLAQLELTSGYRRERLDIHKELLHSGNNTFSAILLTVEDGALLQQTYRLLSGTFEGEMDDFRPLVNEWILDPNIAYHAICNRTGEVIAAANCSYLPLESRGVLAVWYVAVSSEHRGKRLVHELYHNMYQFASNRSAALGVKLSAIVGEASHADLETIERVLRRPEIARKRVYYSTEMGEVEVPYVSPPLKWSVEGIATEEAEPNHLMVKMVTGCERMSVNELMGIITAIYTDSYVPREEDFRDRGAHERACGIVRGYLNGIETALASARGAEVFLR